MNENLNDIYCVIVLFNTALHQSSSFNTLIRAAEACEGKLEVLLYNNSPQVTLNISVYNNNPNIAFQIINDDTNPGVSKAYNKANAIALNNNKKWLLLLDQDTHLDEKFFTIFFSSRNTYKNDYLLYVPVINSGEMIVSPAKYFLYRGFMRKKVKTGEVSLTNAAIINSGVIINTVLFKNAGGYNENIGLDFSDTAFFRRVRKIYAQLFVLDVVCHHSFSGLDYTNYESNLKRFSIYNHNAILFSKEEGVVKPVLFIQVFVRALKLSLKFKRLAFLNNLKYN